jgi:hypothetical protein
VLLDLYGTQMSVSLRTGSCPAVRSEAADPLARIWLDLGAQAPGPVAEAAGSPQNQRHIAVAGLIPGCWLTRKAPAQFPPQALPTRAANVAAARCPLHRQRSSKLALALPWR